MNKVYQELVSITDEIINLGGIKSKEELVVMIKIKNPKLQINSIREFLVKYEKEITRKLKVLGSENN